MYLILDWLAIYWTKPNEWRILKHLNRLNIFQGAIKQIAEINYLTLIALLTGWVKSLKDINHSRLRRNLSKLSRVAISHRRVLFNLCPHCQKHRREVFKIYARWLRSHFGLNQSKSEGSHKYWTMICPDHLFIISLRLDRIKLHYDFIFGENDNQM